MPYAGSATFAPAMAEGGPKYELLGVRKTGLTLRLGV